MLGQRCAGLKWYRARYTARRRDRPRPCYGPCAVRPLSWSVGVIGAGQVVRNAHLPVLTTSLDAAVAWIFDIDPRRAALLAHAYRAGACRPEDLKHRVAGVDVVLLAAPFGARAPYYEILAGCPSVAVFVEKPPAKTVEEHLAICRPYADYQIACDFNRRASDTVGAARDLLAHQVFGPLREVRAAFGRRGAVLGGGQYNSDLTLAGGGVLFEMGVHYIDAVLYCTSATDVALESGRMIEDLGFDLHTEARLRLALAGRPDVPLNLTVSVLSDQPEGIEFICERATLLVSLAGGQLTLRGGDGR